MNNKKTIENLKNSLKLIREELAHAFRNNNQSYLSQSLLKIERDLERTLGTLGATGYKRAAFKSAKTDEIKELKFLNELDNIKVGDKRKVYDYNCICTYNDGDFITFHTILKNGKAGKKKTHFFKSYFENDGTYCPKREWVNITKHTSTRFVRLLSVNRKVQNGAIVN